MHRPWPGGLRAQALVGFSVIIALSFALLGLVIDRIFEARLRQSHVARVEAFASAVKGADVDVQSWPEDIESVERADVATHRITWEDDVLIAEFPGAPGVRIRAGKTLRTERESTRRLVVTFLVVEALVLLAFVYGLFTFLVVRPLRAIGVATERASAGDLASPISVLPRNEFGKVGESFNVMLQRLDEGRLELEKRLDALEMANRQIATAQASLVRSEKLASVGQLSAGVAHEIGNPLAAISGFNEILLDGGLDEDDRRDLLVRTQNQLTRIRGIIRKLLDFSRDESPAIEPTSVAKCANEAVDLVKAMPHARSVVYQVDVAPVNVSASPGELVQVLLNLLMNATDALRDTKDPCVRLNSEVLDDVVVLTVADNGPGVPMALRDQIFEPFFTTKDPGEGTGLGLAIASKILERFGAHVRIDDAPESSTFIISLRRWEDS